MLQLQQLDLFIQQISGIESRNALEYSATGLLANKTRQFRVVLQSFLLRNRLRRIFLWLAGRISADCSGKPVISSDMLKGEDSGCQKLEGMKKSALRGQWIFSYMLKGFGLRVRFPFWKPGQMEQEDCVEDKESMGHTPHLLGLPWMQDHHVLMLDQQFATTRFDDMEAIEPKPKHEDGFYAASRSTVPNLYVSRGQENARP